MENPSEPKDSAESLQDWIERAKRAHQLVDAVDLSKVAAHDKTEREKLDTISHALEHLDAGRPVEHVEGVDDVVPQIDATRARKTELLNTLANAGWGENIGRVLHIEEAGQSLQPLELIPHNEGLPDYDICIAPQTAAGAGNFGIFVSPSGVFAASIHDPTSKHHWRIARSRPYDNEDELQQCVAQFRETGFE
ncbi:MAG: hypothetical protein GXP16_11810 [Gammaproteobacteria bacterium]|nr:hypothetical protein [Gammaproteobacteria bacterium]